MKYALWACVTLAFISPHLAHGQDLPSVGDYRFPISKAKPKPNVSNNQEEAALKPEPKATLFAEPLDDQPDEPVRSAKSDKPSATKNANPQVKAQAQAKPTSSPTSSPIASGSINFGSKPSNTEQSSEKSMVTAAAGISPKPKSILTPAASAANSSSAAAPAVMPTNTIPGPTLDLPKFEDGMIKWNVHSAKDVNGQAPSFPWLWIVGLAFLLGTALSFLLQQFMASRRRRKAQAMAANWDYKNTAEIEATTGPILQAESIAEGLPDPDVVISTNPQSEPELVEPIASETTLISATSLAEEFPDQHATPSEIELSFTARQLSATLMNTVLAYELQVTNTWHSSIGPITIGGDMISAHSSMPARAQLEITGQSITPLHTIPSLAPGESTIVSGELRLALAAIIPIQSGDISLFVPLARFRVEALRIGMPPIGVNFASVVGESQAKPDAALKPFRLDLGPRLYSDISQRELDQVA